jgi:hypothetical protein
MKKEGRYTESSSERYISQVVMDPADFVLSSMNLSFLVWGDVTPESEPLWYGSDMSAVPLSV